MTRGPCDAALAAADRVRCRRSTSTESELEAAVRAQEAKIAWVTDAIIAVGVSASLRTALVREEDAISLMALVAGACNPSFSRDRALCLQGL